jgi:methyltransferase (TIGR00027 family)
MDSVAKTSLLTAAMRAVETHRSDAEGRLFVDPYASLLAGQEGKALLKQAIEASGDQPAIAIRTKYIDDRFTHFINEGGRQIVMLAAGMDTRAYRMDFPEGVVIYELDQKSVLQYKEEKLKEAKLNCERKSLAVDLREDWQNQLLQAGFKEGERTLWSVEGLLMYLEELEVAALIKRMNSLASANDVMVFDILSRALLEVPHMQKQLKFLSDMGAPWKFSTNDPIGFLQYFGWKASLSQAADVAPDRWPFPVAPLHIPNVPRGYYVEAIKS